MLGATLKDEQPEDEEEEVATTMAGVAGVWMLMVAVPTAVYLPNSLSICQLYPIYPIDPVHPISYPSHLQYPIYPISSS